ncbi:MAG: phosphoenolpyruvate--protein phosphotransferase [candidate division Zixibacteria bacterium RBG_16_40_9]|nr:MAG: phosphoenolpyruvate--protein phosphotransferase [candidate division Zixibacteria bacterium RBG_16_40_9]
MWEGKSASPGVAIGRVWLLNQTELVVSQRYIPESKIPSEIERFKQALSLAKKEISKAQIGSGPPLKKDHSRIFETQKMILEDEVIQQKVIEKIQTKKINSEWAYQLVLDEAIRALASSPNQYLKERVFDINALKNRILEYMLGIKPERLDSLKSPSIVFATNLSPSDLLHLRKNKVIGLVLKESGVTSHVAILAKSLGLPTVVGLEKDFKLLENGTEVVLDGESGRVILTPGPGTLQQFKARQEKLAQDRKKLNLLKKKPALTKDRKRIHLWANLEIPEEAQGALDYGSEGVGLFRTEFLFMNGAEPPSEEEQFQAYAAVLKKFSHRPVVIRTFDLGGDKIAINSQTATESNPFLGWRAIRVCLDSPEIFETQLKALLRASRYGHLKIMLPFISNVEEIRKAKEILAQIKTQLRNKKVPMATKIPLGIMIEVPSAALNVDILAPEVDFFSLGTNDLIQYTLAVDRTNPQVAPWYQTFHPAILRLIKLSVELALKNKKEIAVCGEMAGETLALPVLIGMGVKELSVTPPLVPAIKEKIGKLNYSECKKIVNKVLQMDSATKITEYLEKACQKFGI